MEDAKTIHTDTACSFCNLAILKQKHIRMPRHPHRGEDPNCTYIAVVHNKERGDCFDKLKLAAAQRAASQRPTEADRAAFGKFLVAKGVIH